ncbi:MAG: hypothetical protein C4518_19660 [Desulfobacteraceae bacterium]|nr:MAG: hypothetical protein C4518_19660 [Desulfobacteraceae bacterium]
MKTHSHRLLTLLCATLLMAGGSSCASFHHRPADQAVKLRVESFMTAKINKDWKTAYAFFDSSYQESISEKQFIRKMEKMEVKAFSIESISVEPDGDRVKVKVKCDVTVGGFDFKGNFETQNWIEQDGEWFLNVPPKDTKEFFK